MKTRLNFATIGALFHAELRMVLRDRRTLVASIILPLLVMPIMLFGSSWTVKRGEQKLRDTVCRYAVAGSQTNAVRSLVDATRKRLAAGEKTAEKKPFHFREIASRDPFAGLIRGDIDLVLEGLTFEEALAKNKEIRAGAKPGVPPKGASTKKSKDREDYDEDGHETLQEGVPTVRMSFRADHDESNAGLRRMRDVLCDTRDAQRAELLKGRGFSIPPKDAIALTEANVATGGQVAGLALGRFATLLLMLFMLMGGAVVAIDSLAGEKERGTLETLLTTAASREEIIAAKHLIVFTVAVIVTLIQTLNLLVYVGFKLIPVPAHFAAAVSPATAMLLLVLFLPVAALASGALLLISGYAKSYREAQLYFFPVFLLGMAPALAPFLPGLALRSGIVLIPLANIAVAAKEILAGTFDWPMIVISWGVTVVSAVWVSRWSARCLSTEKLVAAVEADAIDFAGGPALFCRQVWRWFAVLWGVLLIVSNYTATSDLRVQVAINLIGLFFGASLAMLRWYRLDPREALALRAPKPMIWPAVLIAVPGSLLTGIGLFRLADLIFPVPPKMIEGFSESLVPEGVPFMQLLFCVSVMPGIFEEIAFRGLLLHGLRRRLHPAALAVVVGLVFGLFHVALFRLVPTAFLGVLFAATTLLTGSIYPVMLWHALSNALGILASKYALPVGDLDPSAYLVGAVVLATAFWLMWRHRTPYPGLRPWRRSHS